MTVRELTLHLLDEYENEGKYVNLSLSSHTRDNLKPEERGFLTALLYTTVERKLTYDYYISAIAKRSTEKIDIHTLNILRMGICQICEFDTVPDFAAVNESVKLSRNKGERSFTNGILREFCRLKEKGELPMPERKRNTARYLSIKYSFPLWMAKHFITLLGEEETEKLFTVYNGSLPTDITVNLNKISREDMLDILREQHYSAVPSKNTKLSIRVNGSFNPKNIKGFDKGYFFVQDEACAISAEALGPEKGDRIVDVCACPGGKSFAAAILAGDKGEIYSYDLHESKLSLIEDGASRLGLKNIKTEERDATKPNEELFGTFDRVICDVPCSGLGVLGKKPDMRYKEKESLEELPALQYEILEKSANYLKDGGTLIYSTCTLNREENENNVEKFLENHKEFQVEDFQVGGMKSKDGMLTTYPHKDGCDGFFIAKLKKNGKEK